jgi:hypothetical protein
VIWHNCLSVDSVAVIWQNYLSAVEDSVPVIWQNCLYVVTKRMQLLGMTR